MPRHDGENPLHSGTRPNPNWPPGEQRSNSWHRGTKIASISPLMLPMPWTASAVCWSPAVKFCRSVFSHLHRRLSLPCIHGSVLRAQACGDGDDSVSSLVCLCPPPLSLLSAGLCVESQSIAWVRTFETRFSTNCPPSIPHHRRSKS